MGRPGRTIECTGEPRALASTIAAVFANDGFTRRSAPDELPVHLQVGSQALGVLASSNEIAFALTAIVPRGAQTRAAL